MHSTPLVSRLLTVAVALAAGLALGATPASATTTQTFTNASPLKIPASGTEGPASLYPTPIAVNGMTGPLTDVNLRLVRVGHTNPRDIDIVLVSPSGTAVHVMGGNCGTSTIEDFSWTIDQQAVLPMSQDSCGDFIYRPSPSHTSSLPAPAPPGPYTTSLNDLNGEQANGTWKLYVADTVDDDSGDMEGGWSLTLTTGAVDAAIPASGTSGTAGPYPITRTVSGEAGVLTEVSVLLDGVWHERPDDLDVLLVGPQGQSVVLMSDACGSFGIASFGWVWTERAADPMPDGDGTNVCTSRYVRPTDYEPGDVWPAPAPAGPHGTALSTFDLTDPNGDWRLFVVDDRSDKVGFFTNRFDLKLATRPKALLAFTAGSLEVPEGETRAITLRRSGPPALGAATVTATSVPASATSGVDFTPINEVVHFAPGQREATVPVSALADASDEPAETFAVTLRSATGDAVVGSPSSVAVTIPGTPTTASGDAGNGGTTDTGGGTSGGGTGGTTGGGSRADRTAPTISRLSLSPARFRTTGPTRGSRVLFTLSEAATVAGAIERADTGRLTGGVCRRAGRANARAKRCTRWARAGSLRLAGAAGTNRIAFTGKPSGRALSRGAYRLRLTAADAAGNRSAGRRAKFQVLPVRAKKTTKRR